MNKSKKEITSLDIRFLIKEIKGILVNGIFRKIYQYGTSKTKQFLIDIFSPGTASVWLYVDDSKLFLTKRKKVTPAEPPSFCMFLRKYLMGKRIRNIRQHGFDRIVEISTDDHILIFELFSKGNAILCDSSYNIIMPLEIQRWKHRQIVPKSKYRYPPAQENPFELRYDDFSRLARRSEKNIAAFLAAALGFGSVYANEVCKRASVDGSRQGKDLSAQELSNIHTTITSLDKIKPNPCVYEDVVSPFPLKIYEGVEHEEAKNFSEALDDFFSAQQIQTAGEEIKNAEKEEKEKVERIISRQEEGREKWKRIEKDSKDNAERIYNYYATVESVLSGIRKARGMGLGWNEIKKRIEEEKTPETEAIKEIREGDGIVVLNLGGKDVEIDIRKNAKENAAKYFEDSKWAREKLERTEEAIRKTGKEFERIPERVEGIKKSLEPVIRKKPKKRWYETYRWFISSDGFVVIAGKNATQNENIIKKRAESNDLVFHADIPGAAFVVIKSGGKEISDDAKKEAAEFAAAHCKAWSKGLGTIDIYSVKPDQVSKNPPSGEHLPKGSFMIYGEREWYRDTEVKLAIGVKIDREEQKAKVISGPVMAIRKNSDYFVTIMPGFKRSLELSKNIKNSILIKSNPEDKFLIEKVPLEDFQSLVPAGMGEIVERVSE